MNLTFNVSFSYLADSEDLWQTFLHVQMNLSISGCLTLSCCHRAAHMWSGSVETLKMHRLCNGNIKLARPSITTPGLKVYSSAEQVGPTNGAWLHQKRHLSASSLTGYGLFVKLLTVLFPTVIHPLRCQTATRGRNYKTRCDLAPD